MKVTVTEAVENLEAILQRAEEGDEVVITRNGRAPIQLVRVSPETAPASEKLWSEKTVAERRAALADLRGMGNSSSDTRPGTSNHDILYDENGLPA